MSELKDAVEMLRRLDEKYRDAQLQFSGKGNYQEALRIRQMRIGIEHSIKVIEKMIRGELGLMRLPSNYNPRSSITNQNTRNIDSNMPNRKPAVHDFPILDRK